MFTLSSVRAEYILMKLCKSSVVTLCLCECMNWWISDCFPIALNPFFFPAIFNFSVNQDSVHMLDKG